MLLNDIDRIFAIDSDRIIDQIMDIPNQIYLGWLFKSTNRVHFAGEVDRIVFLTSGAASICGAIVKEYLDPIIDIPVVLVDGFTIPKWVHGRKNLVISISHSGETPETIQTCKAAISAGCKNIVITGGGTLLKIAQEKECDYVHYDYHGKEDYSIGFLFGLTLAVLHKNGIIADLTDVLDELKTELNQIIKIHDPQVLSPFNLSKRLAGQLVNRSLIIVGAQFLSPIAKRWKMQINRCAKSWAQFETIPQLNLDTQESIYQHEVILKKLMVVFIQSNLYDQSNFQRIKSTKKSFMVAGIGTDQVDGYGRDLLTQIWSLLLFGDFVSYYLAIVYGANPSVIENIEDFLNHLS